MAIVVGTALIGVACSSSSNTTGTGGHGGTTGSGGATGLGGATGSGGAVGSGGATGTGGAVGSGGVVGTGGDTGTGGAGGVACPTAVYTHSYNFGSIFEGWTIATNSAFSLVPMAGVGDAAATGSMLDLDPLAGSPMNGSARLSIPFSDVGQSLLFSNNFSSGLNLTGTTITAQLRLDSGLNTSPVNAGLAFLVVKSTGAYLYAPGPSVYLDRTAGFVTLTLDVNAPNPMVPFGYTPCDIREIDVVIQSGPMGTYSPAVVHIDTIAISLPGSTDGGSTEAGSTDAGSTDAGSTDAATDTPVTDAASSEASGQ